MNSLNYLPYNTARPHCKTQDAVNACTIDSTEVEYFINLVDTCTDGQLEDQALKPDLFRSEYKPIFKQKLVVVAVVPVYCRQ